MLWACLLLPHLALDGVLRRRSDADEPLVLVDGPINARTIVAANRTARQAGLYVGQRLTAAQALLARFEAVPYDNDAAARWHRFLAAVAYRYSSEVCLLPHAVVLEVSKSMGLFGPWPRFETLLRTDITQLGFRHRLAVATTPHAAYVLAGLHDGMAVMAPDATRRAFQRVPVIKARLPAHAASRLHAMGLRNLGQVLAMPRDGLRRRFGAELISTFDHLLGDAPHGLDPFVPPDVFDLRIELSHEVENQSALVFPLRRKCSDLAAYLAGRDGGVQQFVVKLEHREGNSTDVPVGLLVPERDPAMLFEFARGRLDYIALPKPVIAMRVIARDLPSFVPVGRDLFDERPAHAMSMEQLRERLRARLGDDAVYRLADTTDPRPELAQSPHAVGLDQPEIFPRPTWLLDRPIPLRGPEPRILAGPERLETGWWDGGQVCRDYYAVETSLGQCAWVFCAPGERAGWMIHGWFA